APYTKWFGTAFNRLRCAPELGPHLAATLAASDWRSREGHLNRAYEKVARMHNALAVTEAVAEAPRQARRLRRPAVPVYSNGGSWLWPRLVTPCRVRNTRQLTWCATPSVRKRSGLSLR